MSTTHASLLVRVGEKADRVAWEAFERRYGPLVLAYSIRLGLSLADAEDVRQDVLAALTTSMASFSYDPGTGRFRDYLRTVVRHAVWRRGRRHDARAGRLSEVDGADGADGRDPHDGPWEQQWRRHHCELAMQTLRRTESERNVEVFKMLLSGADTSQVARTMGLSAEGVRKIKQRVRERLREIFRAQWQAEEGQDAGAGAREDA